MKTIAITGGTGLVGKALTNYALNLGYKIIIVSRGAQVQFTNPNIEAAQWDIANKKIDEKVLKADYFVHLAGAGVMDKRWSTDYKKQIADSRVQSGEFLTEVLNNTANNCQAIVCASAIGYYGPDAHPVQAFTENAQYHDDFLGNTCYQWEKSTAELSSKIKKTYLRIGIVLDKNGGALKEFEKTLPFGVASVFGNGKQIISWIHINDLCKMIIESLKQNQISGVFNAVSSHPISNKNFMKTLGKVKNKGQFICLPVPAFMLKIVLGESSIEVLKSTTVSNAKIKNTGFSFDYDDLETALQSFY